MPNFITILLGPARLVAGEAPSAPYDGLASGNNGALPPELQAVLCAAAKIFSSPIGQRTAAIFCVETGNGWLRLWS
jgi:hypothetical protein